MKTYVGKKQFQPSGAVFDRIQQAGQEFGATTGRVRQCNWLDCGELKRSIQINGVNKLVINKMDVLREVGEWGLRNPNVRVGGEGEMVDTLNTMFENQVGYIFYSDSPEFI